MFKKMRYIIAIFLVLMIAFFVGKNLIASEEKQTIVYSPSPTIEPSASPISKKPFEEEMWIAINDWRENNNYPRYIKNEMLCSYASVRLLEIRSDYSHNGFFAHSDEIRKETGFDLIGENLLEMDDDLNTSFAIGAWTASPTHRKNLTESFTHSCIKCGDQKCVHLFGKY